MEPNQVNFVGVERWIKFDGGKYNANIKSSMTYKLPYPMDEQSSEFVDWVKQNLVSWSWIWASPDNKGSKFLNEPDISVPLPDEKS